MEKPLLSLIPALFLCFHSSAQSIDTLYPQMRYIQSIQEYNDSTWTIITSDAEMHFVNRKGELTGSLAIGEDIGYNKVILNIFDGYQAEQDSFTYIHTFDSHCDYWENELLLKVNREGEVVDTFFIPEGYDFSSTLPYPSGVGHPRYVVAQSIFLVFFDDTNPGFYIQMGNNIERIAISDDGDIAVLMEESILYYEMEGDQLVLSDTIDVDFLSHKFHNLFFTSTGELVFVTENLMLWFENELQNPEIFETDSDFKIILAKETNQQIVVATKDLEDQVYAGVLGFDKEVVYEKILGYHELYFSDVLWIKDSLYVFSGTEYYPDDKSYSFLKTIDFGTTPENKVDIAIDDIKFNQVRPIGGYHCYGDSTNVYSVENITMTITNHGTQPINRLLITPLKSYCYFFCDEEVLGENEILDMDLQPGETNEFYVGHMGVHVRFNEPQDELCLLAVQPDMRIDANHTDNRICFSVIVGTDDEKLVSKPTLFPNPVTNVLYLSSYDEVKTFTLSNSNGIRLTADTAYSAKGIDMSPYMPGLYIVEMELKSGERFVERVVKL